MGIFRTPLRYPGGKQKLTPFIEEILKENNIREHYVEPYAGGSGIAIQLLISKKIKHVHLNDIDRGIYAFWHSILNKTEKFCNKIMTVSLTVEEWRKQQQVVRNKKKNNLFDLGFATFYLNRCNRSGVISGGVIGGLNQDGNYKIDARFSRSDLIRRIEAISIFKKQISISNLDAEKYIENYIPNLPKDSLIYFDPPYFNKAKDLYINSYQEEDHARLAKSIQRKVRHKWILSYDGVPEILNLYQKRRHFIYDLQYSVAKNYKGKEVFVFSDKINLPIGCSIKSIDAALVAMK